MEESLPKSHSNSQSQFYLWLYPLASGNAEGTFLRLPYTAGFPGETRAPKQNYSEGSGRCYACNFSGNTAAERGGAATVRHKAMAPLHLWVTLLPA